MEIGSHAAVAFQVGCREFSGFCFSAEKHGISYKTRVPTLYPSVPVFCFVFLICVCSILLSLLQIFGCVTAKAFHFYGGLRNSRTSQETWFRSARQARVRVRRLGWKLERFDLLPFSFPFFFKSRANTIYNKEGREHFATSKSLPFSPEFLQNDRSFTSNFPSWDIFRMGHWVSLAWKFRKKEHLNEPCASWPEVAMAEKYISPISRSPL